MADRDAIRFRRARDRLLRDKRSGASAIAAEAARLMASAKALGFADHRIRAIGARIVRAHPAMGSVWNAVHAADPEKFRRDLHREARGATRLARRTLPKGTALTLSYSSTVLGALGKRGRTVIVAESLPGGEGIRTARALRRAGASVTVIADAGMAAGMAEADFAVVGADAITTQVVVNKVGTYLLALVCRQFNKPLFAIADVTKVVPDDWSLPRAGTRGLFEATPRELFADVIGLNP